MLKHLNHKTLQVSAAFMTGLMISTSPAHANNSGNNFSSIAENITTSVSDLPGLLSALAYLGGIGLGVLGILGIKDHVEQPSQKNLKDGAIKLAAGGGLFALPIVYEAMLQTVGDGANVNAPTLNAVGFNVN